jgi:hypothetical protein
VGRRKWLISDVPPRHGDRRANGPRAAAAVVIALAVAFAAVAIGGCGGGGSGGSSTSSATNFAGANNGTTSQGTTDRATSTTSTGGGSAPGQVGQRLTIPEVVEAVLTSSDPAKACGKDYVTSQYVKASYGDAQGCRQSQTPKNAATSVDINGVAQDSSDPSMANVKAVPSGGVNDGEKLTVSLVKEDGAWKVDALKSNAPVGP